MRLRWTTPALKDFEQIGDYIAKESTPQTAASVLRQMDESIAALIEYPQIGRAGRVPGTRELVVANSPYVVAYRVQETDLQILAVFHGARRWPEKFQ
jgi:toxin ParE1/3/4